MRDILIIIFDCLRQDQALTVPALREFMESARSYPDALSAGTGTPQAVAGILFGGDQLLAYEEGTFSLAPQARSLAEMLPTEYSSGFFTGNHMLSNFPMLHRGFGHVWMPKLTGTFCPVQGAEVFPHAQAWWQETKPPRFCYLHFFEPHPPYTTEIPMLPPTERVAGGYEALRMSQEEYDYLKTRAAAHATSTIPPLLEGSLQMVGDETVVVVTSDHGQAFGEGNVCAHGPNPSKLLEDLDLTWQIPAVRRVPFAIRLPGETPREVPGPTCVSWLGKYLAPHVGILTAEDERRTIIEQLQGLGYIA